MLLKAQSSSLIPKLKELHRSQDNELIYPQSPKYKSAIYDIDTNYIFGDFKPKTLYLDREYYQEENMLYAVIKVYPYYLGAAFIVIQKDINYEPIHAMEARLIVTFIIATIFISLIAYWLGNLFLSPIRQSITLLDNFIKDTTHELNTPLSTILANAELLKSFHPELEKSNELRRIETATKRLSRIYDDLAYIRLNHKRHTHVEKLNISALLKERLDYFDTVAVAKQISFTHKIDENIYLHIDKEDIIRIIDNLLGNAFKYTMIKGQIDVTLNELYLSIKDNGIGINKDAKKEVLKRFVRDNSSEGGFGLGLSIVADIVKHYNFDIEIQSELNKGTKVSIIWAK